MLDTKRQVGNLSYESRESTGMSQAVFARLLNVSPKTIQSWEQGQRVPSQAAQRMLHVFQERPEMVLEVVGMGK